MMQGVSGGKTNTTCLVNPDPNRPTISLQMCGNGIVEAGEDCDPGKGVNSTCCNSSTCKFLDGAVCDPASSPCCTRQCGFAPSTQVCRASKDPLCDVAEMCPGNSSACPHDVVAPNGRSCAPGLACASGQCTSVAKQCQAVGAAMNLTEACPNKGDQSCQVSCKDPTAPNRCVVLQSQLIDGSPCGFGGSCSGGSCQAADALDTAKAWFTQNLQISIPITVVAGIALLGLLWALISSLRRCCARRRDNASSEPALSGIRGERLDSWPTVPGVQPEMYPRYNDSSSRAPGPPPVLQPGSNASFSRYPSTAHSSNSSMAARDQSRGLSFQTPTGAFNSPIRQPFPSRPIRENPIREPRRANWVDESLYNGPR